jgi:hypothetical protein
MGHALGVRVLEAIGHAGEGLAKASVVALIGLWIAEGQLPLAVSLSCQYVSQRLPLDEFHGVNRPIRLIQKGRLKNLSPSLLLIFYLDLGGERVGEPATTCCKLSVRTNRENESIIKRLGEE